MSGEGLQNPYDDTALLAFIAIIDAIVDAILEDTVVIGAQTGAMAVLEEAAGQLTTDGTEQNLYINNAPAGVFRPICVKIDFTNQTAGETVVVRTYYRIALAGNLIEQDIATYIGLVSPELISVDLEPNRYGVAVTIEKTGGANRAYDWEATYEV